MALPVWFHAMAGSDGNPLHDLRALLDVRMVLKDGVIIRRR